MAASHSVGAQVAAIALPTILITELLGAALVSIALARTGESVRPWRQSGSRTAADAEVRP